MYDRIIRGRSMYNGQAIRQSMHARVSVFTTVVVVVSYANVNVFGTAVCKGKLYHVSFRGYPFGDVVFSDAPRDLQSD